MSKLDGLQDCRQDLKQIMTKKIKSQRLKLYQDKVGREFVTYETV